MPAGFTRGFAERLNRLTPFSVREAEGGEVPLPSSVLLAPGGSNLELEDVTGEIRRVGIIRPEFVILPGNAAKFPPVPKAARQPTGTPASATKTGA